MGTAALHNKHLTSGSNAAMSPQTPPVLRSASAALPCLLLLLLPLHCRPINPCTLLITFILHHHRYESLDGRLDSLENTLVELLKNVKARSRTPAAAAEVGPGAAAAADEGGLTPATVDCSDHCHVTMVGVSHLQQMLPVL